MMKYQSKWDRLGVALSLACVVHCVVLPFAVLALPALTLQWLANDSTHAVMALLLIPVAALALVPALGLHRKWGVAGAMLGGLGLISSAAFAGEGSIAREWDAMLTIGGSLILVAAHLINQRLCRSCPSCASHGAHH